MEFHLRRLRFHFIARESITFPRSAGNLLRGALGSALKNIACAPECREARTCPLRRECAYARIFEPAAPGDAPSGLSNPPRPFVFRTLNLDESVVPRGASFHFDINLFDLREATLSCFRQALAQLDRADLKGIANTPFSISLHPAPARVCGVRVEFLTPTELKNGDGVAERPEFPALFCRIRDRVGALSALYGPAPLRIDFAGMGERATAVRMTRCDIRHVAATRRSRRTGQVHSLGGFIGSAEYEGDLTEFMPYLNTAQWTGVGRQTVWGKGAIRVEPIA